MAGMLSIACVGDIMCGDSFYALGHGVSSSIDKYGDDFLPAEIKNIFGEHDLVIGNTECPLSDIGRNDFKLRSLHMRGRANSAKLLAGWGISVANVANNHILEHGYDAAVDTAANLENAGIKTIGSAENRDFKKGLQVAEISKNGISIVFIGVCLRQEKYAFDGGATPSQIIDAVKSFSQQGKVVCVSMHWGNEFIERPSRQQKELGHRLVEAGAMVVLGHHPHVVQGVEAYQHGLIAYSLGNFIFDSFYADCRWSMILSIKFNAKQVVKWSYTPIELDNEHRPNIAIGPRKDDLDVEIAHRCGLLQNEISSDLYEKQYLCDVKKLDNEVRVQLRKHLRKSILKMKPVFWPQIFMRPIKRRLGVW